MGGIVALTIRFSDGKEYRGSCWTNVLPSLYDADFYLKDRSEQHAKEWLDNLLANRKKHKEIEDLWGGWNKLAPIEYGLDIVDYKNDWLASQNGYTTPARIHVFMPSAARKFAALWKNGLIERKSIRLDRGNIKKDLSKTISESEANDIVKQYSKLKAPTGDWESPFSIKLPRIIEATVKLPFANLLVEDRPLREYQKEVEAKFKLTKTEKRSWATSIKEHEE